MRCCGGVCFLRLFDAADASKIAAFLLCKEPEQAICAIIIMILNCFNRSNTLAPCLGTDVSVLAFRGLACFIALQPGKFILRLFVSGRCLLTCRNANLKR